MRLVTLLISTPLLVTLISGCAKFPLTNAIIQTGDTISCPERFLADVEALQEKITACLSRLPGDSDDA